MESLQVGRFKRDLNEIASSWFLSESVELLSVEDLELLKGTQIEMGQAGAHAFLTRSGDSKLLNVKPFSVARGSERDSSDSENVWTRGLFAAKPVSWRSPKRKRAVRQSKIALRPKKKHIPRFARHEVDARHDTMFDSARDDTLVDFGARRSSTGSSAGFDFANFVEACAQARFKTLISGFVPGTPG